MFTKCIVGLGLPILSILFVISYYPYSQKVWVNDKIRMIKRNAEVFAKLKSVYFFSYVRRFFQSQNIWCH